MSKSEEACRKIFQYFVQRSFINCRPSFLGGLELDGYCKSHELAFEYNGIQHYKYYPAYHKSIRSFEKQLERDHRKNKLCKEYGLILMTIPYTYTFHSIYPMAKIIHFHLVQAESTRSQTYMVNRCPSVFLH